MYPATNLLNHPLHDLYFRSRHELRYALDQQ